MIQADRPARSVDSNNTADTLLEDYRTVRSDSEALCAPLALEDYVIQAMPDVSPPKWHLAHTTWFFETFLLVPYLKSYRVFHERYGYLFNSYYETVGTFFPRPQRGLLARPTVEDIRRYRVHVDQAVAELLSAPPERDLDEIAERLVLGLNHEQQHQELLLTDIKYNFSVNPLRPAYRKANHSNPRAAPVSLLAWLDCDGGLKEIGHAGSGFAYDNETPRHQVFLRDYRLASRLVTNGEYLEFIEAGGYRRPEFWLSDAWAAVKQRGWQAPLYWERLDGEWSLMTLSGMRLLDENEPVCHVSFYEADAYARFRGKRLPTEAEWECAATGRPIHGHFRESGRYHPRAVPNTEGDEVVQIFGDVWEWTQSPYAPYPGFKPAAGAIGEYNGKFMCNQMVLRGGSCVTPQSHIRASYRNFFFPPDRWQFTGIRLAEDAS
jgi:ergothioneine biosynthesis protein EgtB